MTSSLCSLWSALMAVMVFLIVPNMAWCHLSSALKAGSGEGNKPPILSHVRVQREDAKRVPIPALQTSLQIKSPALRQFHSNGQTSSSQDFYPTKLFSSATYLPSKSTPIYPVASKVASWTWGVGEDDENNGGDSWENGGKWEPNLLPESKDPTFTPYIGARALNIPGFFQHLQENINAIYEGKGRGSSSLSSPQFQDQMAGGAGEAGKEEKDEVDDDGKPDEEELVKMIATPTRRGYSSNSEAADLPPLQPDGMASRDSRSGGPYTLVYRNQDPDAKTKELLHFLGHGKPEFPRANRYNPAWLFTNLGLGKRSSPSRFKHY